MRNPYIDEFLLLLDKIDTLLLMHAGVANPKYYGGWKLGRGN